MERDLEVLESQTEETDVIREQIEEMRQEAIERLRNLNKQVEDYRSTHEESVDEVHFVEKNIEMIGHSTEQTKLDHEFQVDSAVTVTTEQSRHQEGVTPQTDQNRLNLLHGTTWKLAVNIGREPGTWMPKSWGESGERLLLNLAVEFKDEKLYDREEFLNGMSGAKVLTVVSSGLTVGPSLTEGSRTIAVKDGGWRVAAGEGAAGTDLLRFYFEIEDVAQHKGCDVYCPPGRIYCTCGYFPTTERRGSTKDNIRHEQEGLQRKYDRLSGENEEDQNMFSLTKIARAKELFDIRMEAQKLNERMLHARIREPEKDLLRLSQDGNVGLTREGGVCCKVPKGLAVEYHILGRFGVASLETKVRDVKIEKAPRLRP